MATRYLVHFALLMTTIGMKEVLDSNSFLQLATESGSALDAPGAEEVAPVEEIAKAEIDLQKKREEQREQETEILKKIVEMMENKVHEGGRESSVTGHAAGEGGAGSGSAIQMAGREIGEEEVLGDINRSDPRAMLTEATPSTTKFVASLEWIAGSNKLIGPGTDATQVSFTRARMGGYSIAQGTPQEAGVTPNTLVPATPASSRYLFHLREYTYVKVVEAEVTVASGNLFIRALQAKWTSIYGASPATPVGAIQYGNEVPVATSASANGYNIAAVTIAVGGQGCTSYEMSFMGQECSPQSEYLGEYSTFAACAVKADQQGCSSFMLSGYTSWGCRCCAPGFSLHSNSNWNVYSQRSYELSFVGQECSPQSAYLGEYSTPAACAVKADQQGCSSFMLSGYTSWGCRCCAPGFSPHSNSNWNVYSLCQGPTTTSVTATTVTATSVTATSVTVTPTTTSATTTSVTVTSVTPTSVTVTATSVTATSTVALGDQTNVVGDPHVTNIAHERFDIRADGEHKLVQIPHILNASNAPDLRVDAFIQYLEASSCDKAFMTSMKISGRWTEDGPLHITRGSNTNTTLLVNAEEPAAFFKWAHTQSVEVGPLSLSFKVRDVGFHVGKHFEGRYGKQKSYLNVRITGLQYHQSVGGLLGRDSHEAAEHPPANCTPAQVVPGSNGSSLIGKGRSVPNTQGGSRIVAE